MTDTIIVGDVVEWTEGNRRWRGKVLQLSVIHARVQPTDPPGTADWILTSKLTRVEREAVQGG